MPSLITHCYVVVYDDGVIVDIEPVIHLTQPALPLGHYEVAHIFQNVFLANRYIKENTVGEIKVTVAA